MVVRRKTDLAKNIMKKSAFTHNSKITKKQTHDQAVDEGVRNKKVKDVFQIYKSSDTTWFNSNCIVYNNDKVVETEATKEVELKENIKET